MRRSTRCAVRVYTDNFGEARAPQLLACVGAGAPTARTRDVLVQRMAAGSAEVIVGYRQDALIGPVVLAGMGRRLAEIYRDACVRRAPVDEAEALVEYCVRRCRGWMIAGGSIEILKNRIAETVFGRSFSQRPG